MQNDIDPDRSQLLAAVQGCVAEFRDVGENRHLDGIFESPVHGKFSHGFRKYHVGTRRDAGQGPLDGLIDAFHRQRVGARHDHEIGIRAGVDGGFDSIDHLLLRDHFLARTVAATLGLNLIFDMQSGGAELDERLDGTRDVERPAPPGIGIHQQRQRTGIGDTADVDQHIIHGADAQVRHTQGIGGNAAAR